MIPTPNFGPRVVERLFPDQKYYFPVDDRGLGVWARALCVLDDIEEFHQILKAENVVMQIDADLLITFPGSDAIEFKGPAHSRVVKAMWDSPPIRTVLDDFEIVCWNFYSGRKVT